MATPEQEQRLSYTNITEIDWQLAIKQFLLKIQPDFPHKLSLNSTKSFRNMALLAFDSSRHFINIATSDPSYTAEYNKRWNRLKPDEYACVLTLSPTNRKNIELQLTVASKICIDTNHPLDCYDPDDTPTTALVYIKLQIRTEGNKIKSIWISDRGLAPSLRRQGLLLPLSTGLVTPLSIHMNDKTTIKNTSFHIATLKFMMPKMWNEAIKDRELKIVNGDLMTQYDKPSFIDCEVNGLELLQYLNNKLKLQIKDTFIALDNRARHDIDSILRLSWSFRFYRLAKSPQEKFPEKQRRHITQQPTCI